MPSHEPTWLSRILTVAMMVGALAACSPATALNELDERTVEPDPLSLELSYAARSLHPGEVVLLTGSVSRPVERMAGQAFGQPVHFFATEDPLTWHGLAGIDVETKPGRHTAAIDAVTADGARADRRLALEIEPKDFERRNLSVDPRFVNPPADVMPRIERETKQIGEAYRTLTPERLWSGVFRRPVPGTTTSGFGRLSVFNGEPRSRHRGTDFRAAQGTPIQAPNAGRVVLSHDLYFSGQSVIIDHGWALFSHFAHLSERHVAEGDLVEAGQVVGLVGATGRVTGPHLHWTLRVGAASVDPLSLMALLEAEPVH